MNKFRYLISILLLSVSVVVSAQDVKVRGSIKDSSTGDPVPYAMVNVKDMLSRSMADGNGNYSIKVSPDGILVFSSSGYGDVEIHVNGRELIDIELSPEDCSDSEDIVLPFHVQSRTSFLGSAAVLGVSDISRTQSPDVTRAIEGMVPGVRMTVSDKSPSVLIRGLGTLYAAHEPLYVVDGIPYEGDLSNLNPADIESVTVLKDAASNALYGVRGANGVIMISTRKARAMGTSVSVDARWGVNSKAYAGYETISDPGMYYQTHYNALYNHYMFEQGMSPEKANVKAARNLGAPSSEGGLGYLTYTVPDGGFLIGKDGLVNPAAVKGRMLVYNGRRYWLQPENWMENSLGSSLRQEYNVNVSDSRGKLQTYASIGYLNSKGLARNDGMRRYTARLKTDYQPAETMRMGLNLSYANMRMLDTDIFSYAAKVAPVYPMYLRDGDKNIRYDENGDGLLALDGVRIENGSSKGNSFNGLGFIEIGFMEDFTFTFNAGLGVNGARLSPGDVSQGMSYFNFQEILDWKRTFAGNHQVSALFGHEWYRSESDGSLPYNNNGIFLNARYDYDGKLFGGLSYRSDASSVFASGRRWGSFWSLSGGWLLSEESWYYSTWLDMLKIKASVGLLGNDAFGPVITAHMAENPGMTWEKNINLNIGAEYKMFEDRLSGSLDLFYRKTEDMLCHVPRYSSDFYGNSGSMRNIGLELSVEGVIMEGEDFRWDAYLDLAHSGGRVTELHDSNKKLVVDGYEGYAIGNIFIAEGLPLNTFLVPQYVGVDTVSGRSLWVKDLPASNGTTIEQSVTDAYEMATKHLCGNPAPAVYGGFGTSVAFMDFDFSARFTWQIGGVSWDSGYMSYMSPPCGTTGMNLHVDVLDAWTPDNKDSDKPRFVYGEADAAAMSDRFLVNSSYLNFQNAQFGYTLPGRWADRVMVDRLRVYLACDNIFFLSCRKGFDPRFSFSGIYEYSGRFPMRTVSCGVNVTF